MDRETLDRLNGKQQKLEEEISKPYRRPGNDAPIERINRKRFWISVVLAKDCLFSRRNGYKGKIVLGYSVCIRLFGFDIV